MAFLMFLQPRVTKITLGGEGSSAARTEQPMCRRETQTHAGWKGLGPADSVWASLPAEGLALSSVAPGSSGGPSPGKCSPGDAAMVPVSCRRPGILAAVAQLPWVPPAGSVPGLLLHTDPSPAQLMTSSLYWCPGLKIPRVVHGGLAGAAPASPSEPRAEGSVWGICGPRDEPA